ncbi:hypothetical protein [Paramaledivibacter caminithermalis]|uniref:Uncharacterized protein n=1 Tax=Paramaledivibacter caminithermalis (strain DSM 15212 / CIP 107654 / DViRD3) TaxID=1121301 RepID=A0A1M6T443_PARC5|nr:hypothetical protein [Paramaledivibacter caminithermalis]SHK51548.1 hypothetical protein SAMN02745912_03547 [Paramaledivibacter caminithermalis DSM 15212]
MEKRYNKLYLPIIQKIFTIISCILIILSLGLEAASKKSMGVYRDLVFRKGLLENTILSSNLLNLYKWFLIAGIGSCAVIIILKRIYIIDRMKKYIKATMALSIILLIMILFYNRVGLTAYPLMVVSIGITVVLRYIMIILSRILNREFLYL